MKSYTAEQKRDAIARDLGLRLRANQRRVSDGSMSRSQAEREIEIFRAILADYDVLAAKERAR